MLIYDCLNKKKKLEIKYTKEFSFYEENKKVLNGIKFNFENHDYPQDFNIIIANIYIKGFLTQNMIFKLIMENDKLTKEELNVKITSFLTNCPYLLNGQEKIYLPFYSKALNYLLVHDPLSLNKYPYNRLKEEREVFFIDFFDEYGYQIFSSNFTNLILIECDKTSAAFFSFDFETIYVINDQGGLDEFIRIFDKKLTHVDRKDLLIRIKNVMKIFYTNKRISFINALYDNKLISLHMKKELLKKISKRHLKRLKKQEVKNETI